MRLIRWGGALLLSTLSGAVAAQPATDPLALLDAMSRNFRALDYRGVFTYEQGHVLRSVRIVHAVVDGVEQERLLNLDGEQREFVRRDHPVDCVHAGDRLLRSAMADKRPHLEPRELGRLGRYYSIESDGEERIASRPGERLRITPRDPYRYGLLLVLDKQSSLLLKSETTDSRGRVLERFQFVEVQIGQPVAASELVAETAQATVAESHEATAGEVAQEFAWSVSWLPEGFELSAREVRHEAGLDRAVESQMYTDGLAVFGVFVERGVQVAPGGGQASQGATVAFVTPRGANNVVTVVGEIPIATAQLVANAVNFPDDTALPDHR